MNNKATSNHSKYIKKIVWDNFNLFETAEELLRQRAVEVYSKHFEENCFLVKDIPEDEIIRRGEAEINALLIEKIVMAPEEIYKHPLLEDSLKKQNITVTDLKDGLNFYSNNKSLASPYKGLEEKDYENLFFQNNTIMLLYGYGKLKGFLYSRRCSNSQKSQKTPCFIEWCYRERNLLSCPIKKSEKLS